MRNIELAPVTEHVAEIKTLYGLFSLAPDGRPREVWENRNLRNLRLEAPLRSPWFPEFWFNRIKVNRRMNEAIARVLHEINVRWTPEARAAHGLDQFVKCYCFGDGEAPSLFWYGAAWRLSDQVGGEVLADAVKIFTKHGFTHAYTYDKKRLRDFEYW
jgi:hypothetical protein